MQIVDAQSAETVHGREQTGLLGSKVRVASTTATVNTVKYSHPPSVCACSLCICMHKSMCVRGREGQVGESQVPWETHWLKEGRNEQQADTRAQADVCKDK